MNKRLKIIVGCILVCGIAVLGYQFLHGNSSTVTTEDPTNYPLLARRIFIDDPNDTIINFSQLRREVNDYKTTNQLDGSIYFEYLPTGVSIRVDGDKEEVAASLFKLPAAMEIYKAVELGKVSLDKKITLKQEWLDSGYGDLYKKGVGYEMTLDDAVRIMLEKSDNTALKAIAATLLEVQVPDEQKPYNFLDVDVYQNNDLTISISARSYSSFLKCLYFSCYLDKTHSQDILERLTESNFDNRLKAGIDDKNIAVAHKVGNFAQDTQSDCGIVYIDKRNYMICVMLKGPDSATTDGHIASLSKLVYEFVKSRP